jgi:hypothetical protein
LTKKPSPWAQKTQKTAAALEATRRKKKEEEEEEEEERLKERKGPLETSKRRWEAPLLVFEVQPKSRRYTGEFHASRSISPQKLNAAPLVETLPLPIGSSR